MYSISLSYYRCGLFEVEESAQAKHYRSHVFKSQSGTQLNEVPPTMLSLQCQL